MPWNRLEWTSHSTCVKKYFVHAGIDIQAFMQKFAAFRMSCCEQKGQQQSCQDLPASLHAPVLSKYQERSKPWSILPHETWENKIR